jgi:hypothetical protein
VLSDDDIVTVNGEKGHSLNQHDDQNNDGQYYDHEVKKEEITKDHEPELLQGVKIILGDKRCFVDEKLEGINNFTNVMIRKKDLMPDAPQLTFSKFLTMQQKRVVVTFRFTDLPYLKPYYLTFASKLKRSHSDLFIEKRILPVVDGSANPMFEVLVDGKVVIGGKGRRSRERHVPGGRVDVQNTQSVYVSMEQLGHAISKARKKRRPSTLYGGHNGEDTPEIDNTRRRRTFVR